MYKRVEDDKGNRDKNTAGESSARHPSACYVFASHYYDDGDDRKQNTRKE